jgi:hypothetical protein
VGQTRGFRIILPEIVAEFEQRSFGIGKKFHMFLGLPGNITKKRARAASPRPLFPACSYLQPSHEAQQSADAQHVVCAFAVPATPSAITAINSITFSVFIVFSFRSGKSVVRRMKSSARGTSNIGGFAVLSKYGGRELG